MVSSNLTLCRYIYQVASRALYVKKADSCLNYITTCTTSPALRTRKRHGETSYVCVLDSNTSSCTYLLEFVKSIRKGDFKLCTQVLNKFIPCMFILNHYNYMGWLLVHLNEIANLHKTHPAVYCKKCVKGKLTVQKSKGKISKNALGHNHEQMNVNIKERSWRCNWSDRKPKLSLKTVAFWMKLKVPLT